MEAHCRVTISDLTSKITCAILEPPLPTDSFNLNINLSPTLAAFMSQEAKSMTKRNLPVDEGVVYSSVSLDGNFRVNIPASPATNQAPAPLALSPPAALPSQAEPRSPEFIIVPKEPPEASPSKSQYSLRFGSFEGTSTLR